MTPLQSESPRRDDPNLSTLDPALATCQLLVALFGAKGAPVETFIELVERNRALVEAPAREIRESLARQVLLLEALWLHYSKRAALCKRDDHAALLQKTALACQAALSRTQGVIHGLDREAKDKAAIDA